jgi:PilZ domain
MGSRLLELLRLGRCSHEFSWPRRWPDGEYYQVCLLCGEEYRYDWKTMSRQERVSAHEKLQERPRAGARRTCSPKKPSWSPRARRVKLNEQEIKYRVVGTAPWLRGSVENVSQTGVLFRAAELLPENTEVELILEMPRGIISEEHGQVIARGMVVRAEPAAAKGQHAMAAGIWDYRVLYDPHENRNCESEAPPSPQRGRHK